MPETTVSQDSNPNCPDVSVIIPTYNRVAMLEEALSSVQLQDFDGTVEIIVVDDHSQDGTSARVSQKYPDVHLISLKQNAGAYVARNLALSTSKGKYVAFLDSDDLWEPNYLKSQLAALEGKERCFSVSGVVLWDTTDHQKDFSSQKPDLVRFTSPIHQLFVSASFIVSPSSVVFYRSTFDEVGLFDETFRLGSDRGLYLRCFIADYNPIFTEQPLAVIRRHDQGQLTYCDASTIELRKKTRLAFLDRFYPLIETRSSILPIRRLYAEIYSTAAKEFFESRYFLRWISSSLDVAKYSSFKAALVNMMRDIVRPAKKYLPSRLLGKLKRILLSDGLSF